MCIYIYTKINKCDLMKCISFPTAKKIISKTDQPSKGEKKKKNPKKKIANKTMSKKLISKIFIELMQLNMKKAT